ncbi:MAG: M28 family peptidase [Bacteroidales bacterium]|nr:M28 family peptidase [Bacteroidales bacterium]
MNFLKCSLLSLALALISCSSAGKGEKQAETLVDTIPTMDFNADTAYAYIKAQVDFGPRTPGSEGHRRCGDWLVATMNRLGADTVFVQEATLTAYNGDQLPARNIIARYNGDHNTKRVLILAHWDTRPWADQETDMVARRKPVIGANDGASGVAVAMEIARQLQQARADVGVDILFTDCEDYGRLEGWGNSDDTWCLGTQYFLASNFYAPDSLPAYGILLDMVGAQGAKFHREYTSHCLAPRIVDKVWSQAQKSGYESRFPNELGGAVVDDHQFVNKAGIPCIDIIESLNDETRTFHPTWHTLRDDITVIDPATLKAVGQVVTDVIYNEPA